jgi:IS605 OrfB family transposase
LRFGAIGHWQARRFGRVVLPLKGKTTEQLTAILSDALDKVLAIAKAHCCPIAIEDLDFTGKKRELTKLGVRGARMLIGLAYARYKSLVLAKAAKSGSEIIIVDPAYTSVAWSVK